MDSFQNPIGGKQKDPYEHYRIETIEREKIDKERSEKEPRDPGKKKGAFGAYILLLFHKFLELFEGSYRRLSQGSEKETRKNLLLLKRAFETLKKEDRSQDSLFLNELAKLWHRTLEDALHFKQSTPLANHFKDLIGEIESYPKNQEHTLGYYFTEYAGQKWLPFPYMEMIQTIHAEYKKNPGNSALEEWTRKIQELILLLGS